MLEILALAAQCAPYISESALKPIIRTESAGNAFAIGVNKDELRLKKQPQSFDEAASIYNQLHQQGIAFGVGPMQIDSQHHRRLGWINKPEIAFDKCTNLMVGHNIFVQCYNNALKKGFTPTHDTSGIIQYSNNTKSAYGAAASCYNSGNFQRGFANGYVQKVVYGVYYSGYTAKPNSSRKGKSRKPWQTNYSPTLL